MTASKRIAFRLDGDAGPEGLRRLELPERVSIASARRADLALLAKAPAGYLDTTHFDIVRFPPPPWALEQFERAASDGSLALQTLDRWDRLTLGITHEDEDLLVFERQLASRS